MIRRYPLAPFAVLYAAGLVVANLGTFEGASFLTYVAEAMIVIALVSTLVLSGALLRERRVLLAWCALVGAVLLLVAEVYAFVSDPFDNSIGAGVLLLVGWPLGIAGAFTRRVPVHPSVRR